MADYFEGPVDIEGQRSYIQILSVWGRSSHNPDYYAVEIGKKEVIRLRNTDNKWVDLNGVEEGRFKIIGQVIMKKLHNIKDKVPVMKSKNFTNQDMLAMEEGTLVRIKAHIKCAEQYHIGGRLVKQRASQVEDNEKRFGIKTASGVCWFFSCNDYEVI